MNLNNRLKLGDLLEKSSSLKKIFFYRVCGTGMGAAACLAQESGYEVEGADLHFYPPMSNYLEEQGIPLHPLENFDWNYLRNFDLIVVGNVVPRKSKDAQEIEKIGVPFCSFPAFLGGAILKKKNVVGVGGTHGKTTTTYFLTQMFESFGKRPGYFIGGVLEGRKSSQLGDGKYFFIESDEYDSAYFEKISKFRSYCLNDLILTSLEFDHADIFENIEDIKEEFRSLFLDFKGRVIAECDYPALVELKSEFNHGNWFSYGKSSDFGPRIIRESREGTIFQVKNFEKKWMTFETNIVGEHNILNLTACILFSLREGISLEKIQRSLKNLLLVKRRQEIRGIYRGSIVIDDFAHHPRSVQYTIDSVRTKFPHRRIIVVLEPNSATARSDIFQNEFALSLQKADRVIFVKPERETTVKFANNLNFSKLSKSLESEYGIASDTFSTLDSLQKKLDELACQESLFLILSNSTCLGLWKSHFVESLKVLKEGDKEREISPKGFELS